MLDRSNLNHAHPWQGSPLPPIGHGRPRWATPRWGRLLVRPTLAQARAASLHLAWARDREAECLSGEWRNGVRRQGSKGTSDISQGLYSVQKSASKLQSFLINSQTRIERSNILLSQVAKQSEAHPTPDLERGALPSLRQGTGRHSKGGLAIAHSRLGAVWRGWPSFVADGRWEATGKNKRERKKRKRRRRRKSIKIYINVHVSVNYTT